MDSLRSLRALSNRTSVLCKSSIIYFLETFAPFIYRTFYNTLATLYISYGKLSLEKSLWSLWSGQSSSYSRSSQRWNKKQSSHSPIRRYDLRLYTLKGYNRNNWNSHPQFTWKISTYRQNTRSLQWSINDFILRTISISHKIVQYSTQL